MARTAKTYSFSIASGAGYALQVAGRYFKILSATGALRVDSFDGISLDGMTAGNGVEDTPFSRLHFTDQSGGANNVKVVVSDEKFIDSSLGAVAISTTAPPRAAMVHSAPAVTTGSTAALAANATRSYLLLQNQHGAGNVWVNVAGGAAVASAACIKIPPGGSYEPETVPTGGINIIGDVAHNLLAVLEG